jgi:AcrR family transcriptional regulator
MLLLDHSPETSKHIFASACNLAYSRKISDSGVMPNGLRERKKVATKDALSHAALSLAIEQGLDRVTADSIAARAQVSTRTFHNYFAHKEEAILFILEKGVRGVIDSFTRRDADEPVLDSFEALFMELVASQSEFDRMVAVTRLMAEHATLFAHHVAVYDVTSDALLIEIGRRTGTDPTVHMYPRLVFQCANAVVRAATELHLRTDLGTEAKRTMIIGAVRDGFAQLRLGLPQPVCTTPEKDI